MKLNIRKKGQVEFVVIAALIIIAIAVMILASRQFVINPPVTTGIPDEAKTIKDAVMNLIKAGTNDRLALIYNQGGTFRPGYSVKFGMFDTEVWLACGNQKIPDVSQEIGAAILDYLRENLQDEMNFYGKNTQFDFSKSRYEVEIFKDKISIRIYLPTLVEAYEMPQPYEVIVDSKLYDVLELSKNLVKDASETSFFEMVTLATMINTNPENKTWTPLAGARAGCGNYLFRTRTQLLSGIKEVARYTASHIVWNNRGLRLAENPFYPLTGVGGKDYSDMDVMFSYPTSWDSEMDKYFTFSPDPLRVIPKPPIPLVPFCMSSYAVSYNLRYPIIVMVHDSILNQWLKFGVMVNIEDTAPGNCSVQMGNASQYAKLCISNAKCDAEIKVKNTTGDLMQGVDVGFYICDLGTTNEKGVVEGKIPCMISELSAFKPGYKSYGDLVSSDDLKDKTVKMTRVAENISIYMKGLKTYASGDGLDGTDDDGKYANYAVVDKAKDIADLGYDEFDLNLTTTIAFSPADPNYFTGEDTPLVILNYDNNWNAVSAVNVSGLLPIGYNILVAVNTEDGDDSLPVGFLNTSYTLQEGQTSLYFYIPVVVKGDGLFDLDAPGIDASEADQLTNLAISTCGAAISKDEITTC
jgi:hypothetical protein